MNKEEIRKSLEKEMIGVLFDYDWQLISDKLDQAIKEERERVEDMRNSLPPYPADKDNPMKHMYQNEGYSKALDDIIYPR